MDSSRSSNSTLTMKDSDSRPQSSSNFLDFQNNRQQKNYRRQRRRSSSQLDIYKTPQVYPDFRQNSIPPNRSFCKKYFLLIPAIAFQFCIGLTSVFSIINLHLLGINTSIASVQLILAAILSIGLTTAFRKLIKKLYGGQKHLAMMLICFTMYLSMGTLLVIAANVEVMLNSVAINQNITWNVTNVQRPSELSTDQLNLESGVFPNESFQFQSLSENVIKDHPENLLKAFVNYTEMASNMATLPWQHTFATNHVALYSKIMAFIGYVIMTSSLSCGHYLLCCVATSLTHPDDNNSINTIETAAAAIGGCAVTFLGAVDLSFSWYSSNECIHLLIGHIFILLCITLILLIGCTICSLITWFSDVIMQTLRPSTKIEENILIGRDRRPTRTAQEIFDECAALLGYREHVSYTEEYLTPRNLPSESNEDLSNSITQSETVIDDPVFHSQDDATAPYVLQLPVPVITREQHQTRPWRVIWRTQKKFIQFFLLMFFLSGTLVSIEYNSPVYLSYVIHDGNDDCYGQSYGKIVRTSSAGIFVTYLASIATLFFYESYLPSKGCKLLALGTGITAALLTLALAISNDLAVYFTVTCLLGVLRVILVKLPLLVSVQSQMGSQPSTLKQILIEAPSTVAWCMTPLSLCLASVVTAALTDNVPGFQSTPVYYSTVSAILACVLVSTLL